MEVGNLTACDRAFGRHINSCPWSLNSSSLRDFASRPSKERIYRGENEDPLTFLKILAQSLENNKIKLPIIGYFRGVGFGLASNDVRPIEQNLTDGETLRKYPVAYVHYRISYRVAVISHSRSALHEVALPLHYYLSRNKVFNVFYRFKPEVSEGADIGEEESPLDFTIPATLMNSWGTDFENTTAKLENITQIHAAHAEYQLKAPVFFMDNVEAKDQEIEFMPIITQ